MNDRSVNVSGSFTGSANTGDYSVVQSSINNSEESDITEVLSEILTQLAQRYPTAPPDNKQIVFQMEVQQLTEANPTFKQRLLNSAKAGGFELAKVLLNNPFVAVPLEMFKGWIES